jgi:ABC-type lipoprotein release transport system permease subunit
LFVIKAIILGFIGGVAGCLIGITAAWLAESRFSDEMEAAHFLMPGLYLVLLITTPVVTMMASWLPALQAARRDVAGVLTEG